MQGKPDGQIPNDSTSIACPVFPGLKSIVEDDVMQNLLQQLNWAQLLSHGTNSERPSHRCRKARRKLLTSVLNLQDEVYGGSLGEKLEITLARLHYSHPNRDGAALNSLREFACAVEAQSGKRIRPADANALASAAREIIDVLMSGCSTASEYGSKPGYE